MSSVSLSTSSRSRSNRPRPGGVTHAHLLLLLLQLFRGLLHGLHRLRGDLRLPKSHQKDSESLLWSYFHMHRGLVLLEGQVLHVELSAHLSGEKSFDDSKAPGELVSLLLVELLS